MIVGTCSVPKRLSGLPRYREATKPDIDHPRWLTFVAFVVDPILFTVVWATIVLSLAERLPSGVYPLLPLGLVVGLFYFYAFIFALPASQGDDYPWFLALKARKQNKRFNDAIWSQGYWFGKFRFRLRRYLKRNLSGPSGELAFRFQVRGMLNQKGVPLPSQVPPEPPGLAELLRAHSVKSLEESYFTAHDDRFARMTAESERLESCIVESKTLTEAYIRYLVGTWKAFSTEDRALIAKAETETFWDWLDRSQTRFWLFRFLVAAGVVALVYAVLRVVPFVPGF